MEVGSERKSRQALCDRMRGASGCTGQRDTLTCLASEHAGSRVGYFDQTPQVTETTHQAWTKLQTGSDRINQRRRQRHIWFLNHVIACCLSLMSRSEAPVPAACTGDNATVATTSPVTIVAPQ